MPSTAPDINDDLDFLDDTMPPEPADDVPSPLMSDDLDVPDLPADGPADDDLYKDDLDATDDSESDLFGGSEFADDDMDDDIGEDLDDDIGEDIDENMFEETPDADATMSEDEGLDDLFGVEEDPAPTEPAIEEPAGEYDLEDLFGGEEDLAPVDEAPPADAAAPGDEDDNLDDLFESGDDEPASEDDGLSEDLDDLFSSRAPAGRTETRRTETGRTETLPVSFVQPENDLARREWTDNTGSFRTVGRLIRITGTEIRILKSNGNHCTVPLRRLSDADFEYVRQQSEQGADRPLAGVSPVDTNG